MTPQNTDRRKLLSAALLAPAGSLAAGTAAAAPRGQDLNMPLLDALKNRHSPMDVTSAPVESGLLSQILWAACGENRKDTHKRTAPSSRNSQDITVYAVRQDGVWVYEPGKHAVAAVIPDDLRAAVAARQTKFAGAPLFLLLVTDRTKVSDPVSGGIDAGLVAQNVCLACVSLGLAPRPRTTMNREEISAKLKLPETQVPVLNIVIGREKTA